MGPTPEELTNTQETELVTQLHQLLSELSARLERIAPSVRPVELDQSAVGRLSRMDALQQQAMARANQKKAKLRVAQCQAALQRAHAGTYGRCLNCEDPVGYPRLAAYPEAAFCVDCQSQDR